jgi:anti-sigma B factor antagonist
MSRADFTFRDDAGNGLVVLEGEIDVASADRLLEGILAALDGVTATTLDLTLVTFIDSGGLRMIHQVCRTLAAERRAVVVIAPPGGAPRRLLELTGLDDFVPVKDW